MNKPLRAVLPAALLLAMGTMGCIGPGRAKSYAAYRSGCKPDQIEVVEQDGHDLTLNVCGVYEDWEWSGFNGWEYIGPSADQPAPLPQPIADADGDRIPDAADACPQLVGVVSPDPKLNGCPTPPDADGDGIADATDKCPQQAGPANPDPMKNGCPPPADADGDGIADADDKCPQEAGEASTVPGLNGCNLDKDGDGIKLPADECPEEKGVANEDPRLNGCPEKDVILTAHEIVITDKIEFSVGSARIKKSSYELLDKIAKVMKEHPDMGAIEVQGHTDNTGSADINKKLSAARAEAVKKALVERGVDEALLHPKGYGPDKPLADNGTPEGQAKNRRVQFVIESKAGQPAGAPPPATPTQ